MTSGCIYGQAELGALLLTFALLQKFWKHTIDWIVEFVTMKATKWSLFCDYLNTWYQQTASVQVYKMSLHVVSVAPENRTLWEKA